MSPLISELSTNSKKKRMIAVDWVDICQWAIGTEIIVKYKKQYSILAIEFVSVVVAHILTNLI